MRCLLICFYALAFYGIGVVAINIPQKSSENIVENITVPNNFKNNYGPIFNSSNGSGGTYNLDFNYNNNLNDITINGSHNIIYIVNHFECDDLVKKIVLFGKKNQNKKN